MQTELKNYACIIIDDPLLKENYGCLNYRKLLDLMDEYNFCVTIAFIPWNYNRTDQQIAALFRNRPDRLSLCVHGCDHTWGEFGNTDIKYLDAKIKLATARMVEHERKTGVHFDKVMVFPQGIFSNESLESLKRNKYMAAVNTTDVPINGPLNSKFPFFKRYKPEGIKNNIVYPIFIVLHHDDLKCGYEKIKNLVAKINSHTNNIRWDSVGNIIRHYLSYHDESHQDLSNTDLSGLSLNGYRQNIKIFLRRYASEFRDNYLSKNDNILKNVKKIKKLLANRN